MLKKSEKNFILVEFLIFFAVAAVLLLVAGLVLTPLARFKNFRDSRRWIDITEILNAVKTSQIDGDDSYFIFSDIVPGEIYMITDGKMVANCDQANANCDTGVTDSDNCVDLSEFVALGYLKKIPISPMGRQKWTASATGYTLQRSATGIITVRACESENTDEIRLSR